MDRHLDDDTGVAVDNDEARQLLLAERKRLLALLQDEADLVRAQQDDDPQPADQARELLDLEMERSEFIRLHAELKEVDAALERIDQGTYGISEISGKPIPDERLRAIPYTRVLVEEQELIDRELLASDPNNPERRL
jgi:RNA polymerase-binding transcription factor DksA